MSHFFIKPYEPNPPLTAEERSALEIIDHAVECQRRSYQAFLMAPTARLRDIYLEQLASWQRMKELIHGRYNITLIDVNLYERARNAIR